MSSDDARADGASAVPTADPLTPIDLLLPGAWRTSAPGRGPGGAITEGNGSDSLRDFSSDQGTGPLAPVTPPVRPPQTLELPLGSIFEPGERTIDLTALERAEAAAPATEPFWQGEIRIPIIREPSPVLGGHATAGGSGTVAVEAPVVDAPAVLDGPVVEAAVVEAAVVEAAVVEAAVVEAAVVEAAVVDAAVVDPVVAEPVIVAAPLITVEPVTAQGVPDRTSDGPATAAPDAAQPARRGLVVPVVLGADLPAAQPAAAAATVAAGVPTPTPKVDLLTIDTLPAAPPGGVPAPVAAAPVRVQGVEAAAVLTRDLAPELTPELAAEPVRPDTDGGAAAGPMTTSLGTLEALLDGAPVVPVPPGPPGGGSRSRRRRDDPAARRSTTWIIAVAAVLALVAGIAATFALSGLPSGSDSVSLDNRPPSPTASSSPTAQDATEVPSSEVTTDYPPVPGPKTSAAALPTSRTTTSTTPRTSTTKPRATTSSTRPRPTTTRPSTTQTRPGQVYVDPARYIGRRWREAQAALQAMGLQVFVRQVPGNRQQRGTVLDVRPSGWVPVGSFVRLTVAM